MINVWSKNKTNRVTLFDAQPSDSVVMIQVDDDRSYVHISQHADAIKEALQIADQKTKHQINVIPLDVDRFIELKTGKPAKDFQLSLTPDEREELRLLAIDACKDVLKKCPDQDLRVKAANTLIELGVFQ
ncbi:hypothetical protein ACYX78_00160 [Advenella incenata]